MRRLQKRKTANTNSWSMTAETEDGILGFPQLRWAAGDSLHSLPSFHNSTIPKMEVRGHDRKKRCPKVGRGS